MNKKMMATILAALMAVSALATVAFAAEATTPTPRVSIEQKKDALNQKVANGTMTQEQADEIIAQIEERMANCDGSGVGGRGMGIGKGMGKGMGRGAGGCGGCQIMSK